MAIKKKEFISVGVAHVKATFNNTFVSICNLQGDVMVWSSAGANGFKGSRKSTPYAAQVTAEKVARQAMENGLATIAIKVDGPGAGRESAIRALAAVGLNITGIHDVTRVPHNGCRPPKRRRV